MTREPDGQPRLRPFRGGQTYELEARSLVLFRPGRANRSARAGRHVQAANVVA